MTSHFSTLFSDVISRGNCWWGREMSSVSVGQFAIYGFPFLKPGFNWCEWGISQNEVHWPIRHYSHGYFVLLKFCLVLCIRKYSLSEVDPFMSIGVTNLIHAYKNIPTSSACIYIAWLIGVGRGKLNRPFYSCGFSTLASK